MIRSATRPVLLMALLLALPAAMSACKPPADSAAAHHDEDDGHGHAEGHDHDHDHGEEAGHADHREHAEEVVLTAEAIIHYGIKEEPAQRCQLRPTMTAPARVAFNAEAMAHVGSPLPGRVIDLKVRLGQEVGAGDALATIESPELGKAQSDFLIKRTAAESAGPAVELARSAWERAQSLYASSQGITLTELQRREAEHKAAIAALKSAQAEAAAAESHLRLLGMAPEQIQRLLASGEVNPRLTIVSPIAGQVVQREVTLGELVGPERDALLIIADMRALWVLADVPEAHLRDVAVGARAWVRIGGGGGARHEGSVAFIAPMIDARTRTAQVRIEVREGAAALRPGMFAQAEIVATDSSGADVSAVVAVPEQAVQTVEGASVVFVPVPDEDNTFAKRVVSVGKSVGGMVPIHAGLAEGERFIAAGSFILKAELGKGSAGHEH